MPAWGAEVPPWLLHEGKGYAEIPGQAILDWFRRVREESLALIRAVTPEQWG